MMMSNGIIYSQGMEIPDFSGERPPITTDTSDVSSPHGGSADTMNYSTSDISSPHGGSDLSGGGGSDMSGGGGSDLSGGGGSDMSGGGGSDVSGGGGSDVSGSVNNDPSPSTDPFSPQLPGFAGILDGGTDGGPGGVESFNVNSFDFHDPDKHYTPPRSVPEPMTLTLLGTTLLGFGLIRRRKG
jgi:hypothetical protein